MRECEWCHLDKNNYVMVGNNPDGYVAITYKLWEELLKNPENQKLINSLKTK